MTDQAIRDTVSLVIRHIDAIEEAARIADGNEEINRIFKLIDERTEKLALNIGLKGEFSFSEDDGETYFYHMSWILARPDLDDESAAYLWFSGIGEGEDQFWLTTLCGAGDGKIAFGWSLSETVFPKKKDRKTILQGSFLEEESRELEKLGFRYDSKDVFWSIELSIDANKLADAYRDGNLEDCLAPIDEAMDKIRRALPVFDKLVEKARRSIALS